MSLKRILGVAALLATAAAIAQAPTASTPAASPAASPAQAAAASPAAASTSATTTALPSSLPQTPVALGDAHAMGKPGDAKAGQAKAGACAACHAIDGNSTDAQFPKLASQQERYITRQLEMFKSGERENPIMQPMAAPLSPQDMRDIGAYFASQKVTAGVADDSVIKTGPNAGKKFYMVGQQLYRGGDPARGIPACMACHGPTGAGNPGPAYPNIGGQHAKYVVARLTAFHGGLVLGKGDWAKPEMARVAKNLTDEEIQALATYVEGLHPAAEDAAKTASKAAASP
ncbi:MAG: cytochrome c4 [Proteobacteria bacterium]|nr:cytochrome c4 [Pseudomonadota bacterium]